MINFPQPTLAPEGVGGGAGAVGSAASPSTSTPPSSPPSGAPTTGTTAASDAVDSSKVGNGTVETSGGSPTQASPEGDSDELGFEADSAFAFESVIEGLQTSQSEAPPSQLDAAVPPVAPSESPPQQQAAAPTPRPDAGSGSQVPTSASVLSPAEPNAIADALQRETPKLVEYLAANTFKLAPEDVEALETNAAEAIPKLMARLFVQTNINFYRQMAQTVPALIQRMQVLSAKNAENENKFYARWPSLKKEAHGELVTRFARVYRQLYPQASLDTMIEELGPQVMIAAKVGLPGTNGATNVSQPKRNSPFRPAMSGTASVTKQAVDDNPWIGLAGLQYDDE